MSENTTGRELSWDEEIQKESTEFVILPEGDCDFMVTSFERGRFTPGEKSKLPPCPMAILNIRLQGDGGAATVTQHRLYLHSSTEGLLCAFFAAIGQRKHGEKVAMNWNAVTGATGRCKVGIRNWTGKDGEPRTSNEIKKFYDPGDAPNEQKASTVGGYQAGTF